MRRTFAVVLLTLPVAAHAQWTNRYPKNLGFGHQVYLEGYELPVLASGPTDPAPSPDGKQVAIASRGWLWLVDLATGNARRLTNNAGVDSRPAWSPDGRLLAFVRDDSRTTAVMVRDLATGAERELDRGMALDPVFTPDGSAVIYSNLEAGKDLDLWRIPVGGGTRQRLTEEAGLEEKPQLLPDGKRLVYLSKTRAGGDQVRLRSIAGASAEQMLLSGSIISQTRPSLSPNGAELAYSWPGTFGLELRLSSVDRPGPTTLLVARPRGRPIMPAWSADGGWVYFSEADASQRFHLYRINRNGGDPVEVVVRNWDYGVPTGQVLVDTRGPSRITARDGSGHPLIPSTGMVRFDGQNGLIYFYSSGSITIEAPAGPVEVSAVSGLATPPAKAQVNVSAGSVATAVAVPTPLWDATANGWYAGDHHFHLNYGGGIDLAPKDLTPLLAGERVDVGTPMLANLHNRFENQDQWETRSISQLPYLWFSQEVRSHFLGHVGLIGTNELFWPWVWGPGYEVHGRDDRLNAEPLAEAHRQDGLGIYVHPVFTRDPFGSDAGLATIPVELVADAAAGAFDLLEVLCLWSNETGSTELWYRLLNAGFRVMPSAGTDAMTDLHRTMAIGSTRVYVRPEGPITWRGYLAALKAGRSFVTTGPMLDFTIGGARPGEALGRGSRDVEFTLGVHSAMPVDSIAVVVNGVTAWSAPVPTAPFSTTLRGKVRVSAGGWVAARVVGPAVDRWPAMASRTFAHTAPIWIESAGSTDPASRQRAATDLLRALDNAEQRLDAAYAGTPIPTLKAHFGRARARLEGLRR